MGNNVKTFEGAVMQGSSAKVLGGAGQQSRFALGETGDKSVFSGGMTAAKVQGVVLPDLLKQSAAADLAEKIAAIQERPLEPVMKPTFEQAGEKFGALRTVDPVIDHFINARFTMQQIRDLATKADPAGKGKALLARIEEFLKKHLPDFERVLEEYGVAPAAEARPERFFTRALPRLLEEDEVRSDAVVNAAAVKEGKLSETIRFAHNPHSALFKTGTVLTQDIKTMQVLRRLLVEVRRRHQEELQGRQANLAELEGRLPAEWSKLDGLAERRRATLDDYLVGERLLAEHWQEVEAACARRKKVIESNLGLAYVRVRETPLSRALPDPLELRPGEAGDLVPGCPASGAFPPPELIPFLEMLWDVPGSEWAALHDLALYLPQRAIIEQMVRRRRQRLSLRVGEPLAVTGDPGLQPLLQHHLILAKAVLAAPFTVGDLREMQLQGFRIIGLEDLLAVPIPPLREAANQLHQKVVAAAGCLLERLRPVRPSLRLQWSLDAESGRLKVGDPARWPGLGQAESDDPNGTRTLVELVEWLFRQLHQDASAASRTALETLVRACLMLSAGDNPQQLLHGRLEMPPARFVPGQLARLTLNREPPPGSLLQLLDDNQDVVATLRVENHDEQGTVATIAGLVKPEAALLKGMQVTGRWS